VYALQNLPTELSSIYAYINPIIAIILGAIIFNEPLTWHLSTGGAITLLGLYLVNNAIKKKKDK
jgi:drug/metabolite transporter (DMT)-like permease